MRKSKILNKIKIFNLIFALFLLIITIFQIGVFTSEVYFLTQAQKKINQILKENQTLEEEILNSSSLTNLEEFVKKENLVKAEKVKFIQIFEGAVLAK